MRSTTRLFGKTESRAAINLAVALVVVVVTVFALPGQTGLSPAAAGTSTTVIVGPGNQTATGWQTLQGIFGEPGPDTGTQTYEVGPATPPIGVGSLEFRIGKNNNWSEAVGYTGLNNVGLGSLTQLSYNTFVEQASNGAQDFFAILVIDTDGNQTADDFLFFFPGNQSGCSDGAPPQHVIFQNQWQSWDAQGGVWVSAFGLCNAQNFCGTADDPKTLAEYLKCSTSARIINDDAGTVDPADDTPGLIIGYGGDTVSANFIGNLDNVIVGVSGATTIFDFDPCVITCPANVVASNDPNQCGAVVNYAAPVTNDGACGSVICSPASGSFFPVGTTTVTCTTETPSTCSFTVTVNDTQPPTITCPPNQVAVTPGPGQTTVIVNFPPPAASDNCPGVTTSCSPPSGSSFPLGTTTVTCTATDASGNTATCSFLVTTFDVCLQDDSDPSKVLLFNSLSGDYLFCCGPKKLSGIGKVIVKGSTFSLEHNAPDRRLVAKLDNTVKKGTASIQNPPGTLACSIRDSNTTNNTCQCN